LRIFVPRQQLAVFKRRSKIQETVSKKQTSTVLALVVKDLEKLDIGIDSRQTGDRGPMEEEEVSRVLEEKVAGKTRQTCNPQ